MKVENVKVNDLEESIKASKYPMSVDTNIIDVDELHYWLQDDFIFKFIKHQKSEEFPKFNILDDYVEILLKEDSEPILLDEEDLPLFFKYQWGYSNNYCRSNKGELLHRLILKDLLLDDNKIVDHINHNTLDNRKCNLRLADYSQNAFNSNISANNKSGIIGVSWRKDRDLWCSHIFINGKQKYLGCYDNFDDAVSARLKAEKELCGEFAPQLHLFEKYNIEKPTVGSTKAKLFTNLKDAIQMIKLAANLGNTPKGCGEDQYLTGITVSFDLTCSNKMWVEAERYRFLYFVSSQSTMHRITKFDIAKQCNNYVDDRIIDVVRELVDDYNKEQTPENYLKVLYNIPSGFELTARLTTNYRELKTIYSQRKNHRLPEWRDFCKWVETLPYAKELIVGE